MPRNNFLVGSLFSSLSHSTYPSSFSRGYPASRALYPEGSPKSRATQGVTFHRKARGDTERVDDLSTEDNLSSPSRVCRRKPRVYARRRCRRARDSLYWIRLSNRIYAAHLQCPLLNFNARNGRRVASRRRAIPSSSRALPLLSLFFFFYTGFPLAELKFCRLARADN